MTRVRRYRIVVLLALILALLFIYARQSGWAQQPLFLPLFVTGDNVSINVKGLKWNYRALRIGWAPGHQDKRELESILRRGENEIIRIPEFGKATLFLRWYDIYADPHSLEELLGGRVLSEI